MVLGHLSHKIHYYSFDTGDMMFFISFFLNFFLQWCRGSPPFSHKATFTSFPQTLVRHCAFRLVDLCAILSEKSS
jgi:hypothetical protein